MGFEAPSLQLTEPRGVPFYGAEDTTHATTGWMLMIIFVMTGLRSMQGILDLVK